MHSAVEESLSTMGGIASKINSDLSLKLKRNKVSHMSSIAVRGNRCDERPQSPEVVAFICLGLKYYRLTALGLDSRSHGVQAASTAVSLDAVYSIPLAFEVRMSTRKK